MGGKRAAVVVRSPDSKKRRCKYLKKKEAAPAEHESANSANSDNEASEHKSDQGDQPEPVDDGCDS